MSALKKVQNKNNAVSAYYDLRCELAQSAGSVKKTLNKIKNNLVCAFSNLIWNFFIFEIDLF